MRTMSLLKRAVKRIGRLDNTLGQEQLGSFDHARAQEYEWRNNEQVITGTFATLYSDVEKNFSAGGIWHTASDQFFQGDQLLFDSFIEHIRTKKCLEVGSGPYGFLPPARWIKDRVVIEPLADKYRAAQLKLIGKTFFTDDVKVFATGAETLIPELVGMVDGMIMSRNALDHCEDPLLILMNLSKYAVSGCYFLLWTDLWHLGGHDEGHHNITHSIEVMDALFDGLGFDVLKAGEKIRDANEFIEYGRIVRKR
jgi:hypothetical protein